MSLPIFDQVAREYGYLPPRPSPHPRGRHHWRPWPVTAALDPATVELPTVDVPAPRSSD